MIGASRFLCKGKSIITEEWVVGTLVIRYQVGEIRKRKVKFAYLFIDNEDDRYHISDETLCQCTGLKDSSGKLIFEKDILKFKDKHSSLVWYAVVVFGNQAGGCTWGWNLHPLTEGILVHDFYNEILLYVEQDKYECTIVGNWCDGKEVIQDD